MKDKFCHSYNQEFHDWVEICVEAHDDFKFDANPTFFFHPDVQWDVKQKTAKNKSETQEKFFLCLVSINYNIKQTDEVSVERDDDQLATT